MGIKHANETYDVWRSMFCPLYQRTQFPVFPHYYMFKHHPLPASAPLKQSLAIVLRASLMLQPWLGIPSAQLQALINTTLVPGTSYCVEYDVSSINSFLMNKHFLQSWYNLYISAILMFQNTSNTLSLQKSLMAPHFHQNEIQTLDPAFFNILPFCLFPFFLYTRQHSRV